MPMIIPTRTQNPVGRTFVSSNAPASAFGTGGQGVKVFGQGLQQAGNTLDAIGQKMLAEENEAAVKEADVHLSDALRNEMFDPEIGYYAQKGRNAFDGRRKANEAVSTAIKNAGALLSNDRQRKMFAVIAEKRRQTERGNITRHALQERRVWLSEASEARIKLMQSEGIARYNSTSERDRAFLTGLSEVKEQADINGWSPEVRKAKALEYAGTFHGGVIGRMVQEEEYGSAQAYFERFKEQIPGSEHAGILKTLDEGSLRVKTQAGTDEVWARYGSDSGKALSHIHSTYSGKEEDEMVRRYKLRLSEHKTTQDAEKKALNEEVWGVVMQNGIDAVPADKWAKVDAVTQKSMMSYIDKKAKGKPIKTDMAVYAKYAEMSDEDLVQANILEDRPSLSDADFKSIQDRKGKLLRGETKVEGGPATITQQISTLTDSLKLGGQKNQEKRGHITRMIRDAVSTESARLGRDLSYDERQAIVDRAGMDVVRKKSLLGVDNLWADNETPLYEVNDIDEVPEDHVTAIRQAVPGVSDADLVDIYVRRAMAGNS